MLEDITKSLTESLGAMFRGKLTEGNVREGMQKVRQALLEADVNYDVARDFCDKVTQDAVGDKVLKSLNPTEQIISVVFQELINLMGPVDHTIELRRGELSVLMMCGLQGSGKTTTCGKIAKMMLEQGAQVHRRAQGGGSSLAAAKGQLFTVAFHRSFLRQKGALADAFTIRQRSADAAGSDPIDER